MASQDWDLLLYAFAGESRDEAAIGQAIRVLRAANLDFGTRVFAQVHTKGYVKQVRIRAGDYEERRGFTVNAANPRILSDFLNATWQPRAEQQTPRATALILYGHGSGLDNIYREPVSTRHQLSDIQQMMGWDPNSGDFLTNSAVRYAIERSERQHVDVLAFNACSMGMLEIADELRDVCTLLLASQVDATLWPYDALAATLARTPRCSAETLVADLLACMSSQLADNLRFDSLAAFRSEAVCELTQAFLAYAAQALPLLQARWDDIHAVVVNEAQRVYDPYQVDLLSFTRRLTVRLPELESAAEDVYESFNAACMGSVAHSSRGDLHGLSLFCPTDVEVQLARAYKDTRFSYSTWAVFLHRMRALLMQI